MYICVCKCIYIYIYSVFYVAWCGEELKNKVIQRAEFIVKETRRYISLLMNHHPDLRKGDIKCCKTRWMFNKIQKTREEIIYTKKEHTTFQFLLLFLYFIIY